MYNLFRNLIVFLILWMGFAFKNLPSKYLTPGKFKTTLLAVSTSEPGRLLYDAAVDGNVEKMKIALKECKGKPDQLNYSNLQRYGRTPLVIACYYNNVDAIKLLLSTPGVDPNKGIDFGNKSIKYTIC